MEPLIVTTVVVVLVVMVIAKTAIVVPQQSAYVVEYLGKYRKTLKAGFHLLIPFVERVAYKHNLKESAVDIQEQICITRDNVQVGVDGVLYLKVLDAQRASYGIGDYIFAIGQLAQTTCGARSEKSTSIARLRSAARSTPRWSWSSTRLPTLGALRFFATRSRTSIHRRTCSRPWRSRCAQSGRSGR